MVRTSRIALLFAALASPAILPWSAADAMQAPAPAASPTRLIGTVTAIGTDALTVKLEIGGVAVVAIGPQTKIVRTAPGEKTLSGATPIHLGDLADGDRVLLRAMPGADATHYTAMVVVAMKQGDIAQAHASQAEDWQKRGVGGIVKSIEGAPPAATIVVTASGRTLSIHVTPQTAISRYAADSVNFADAKPASLSEIQVGDQLRARGEHSPDGSEVTAAEIVAGSFRNVAGTIVAVDAAANTLIVTDLATKKPVILHLTADTQMRKLPQEMAQRLAARSGRSGESAGGRPPGPPAPMGSAPASAAAGGQPGGAGPGAEAAGQAHRGDPAAMLQRAPAVTLAELKKGDAVMIVASRSGGGPAEAATAITLIAGVEPLLESSASGASQSLFSASWNLSGGGEAAAAPQ